MCGIAGIYSLVDARLGSTVAAMTETMVHRGPDGHGYISLKGGQKTTGPATLTADQGMARLFFGHRRLSIIDLAGSRQPLANEDGSVWVVFNGEIYNYPELRRELTAKGHNLKEAGDSEVLVHLWEEYQEKLVDKLVGMFAIAIYDSNRDTLFLARDRFGQKPLYYFQSGPITAFASELQALRQSADFPRDEIDAVAAAQYFRYGYIPSPKTIYKNVLSLPPGHYFIQTKGMCYQKQYWQPRVSGQGGVFDLEELEAVFDEAVRLRLRADVPLGAFLSGGIDSTLIVASMAKQLSNKVATFTINSGDSWCDESQAAKLASQHLDCNHYEELVKPDMVEVSSKLARHYGQPFADYSTVPTHYVSSAARKKVKVALSGDGGDELFAGYQRYANYTITNILAHMPTAIRRSGAGIANLLPGLPARLGGRVADYLNSVGSVSYKGENHSLNFHERWRHSVFTPELIRDTETDPDTEKFAKLFAEAKSANKIERWLEVDQRMYMCDAILVKVDIASMAASLECRSPMLDHRFAELANRLPLSAKLKPRRTKAALRELNAKYLPNSISNATKMGFNIPLNDWMQDGLKDWSHAMIFDSPSWEPFLQKEAVEGLWQEHQSSKWDHSQRLWSIIAWNLWDQAWQ
ncbi:MAG: asparagine synthase (glutamine-hydrolyzing) [Magnetococcales bacterium]|nr:asparagine synthase (glutamine-hydrolyzing) [Magnetococcales bacterium]